jgi:hypothetical protein
VLDETDSIPFGKYAGTPLGEVPAGYLLWLFEQPWLQTSWPDLYEYIEDNQDSIAQDADDQRQLEEYDKEMIDPDVD